MIAGVRKGDQRPIVTAGGLPGGGGVQLGGGRHGNRTAQPVDAAGEHGAGADQIGRVGQHHATG